VLSRLVCTDGRETFLEPLTGIARHPFARTGCSAVPTEQQVSIFNITYIVPAATCDAPQPSSSGARTLFYDLGCTIWGDGQPLPAGVGSGFGPSMPLFDALFREQCAPPDQIYGWEYTIHGPRAWWQHVPASARGRVHFYNVPIEEDFRSDASFSTFLKSTARREDYVVVKVDIDTPVLESTIVHGIAERPELAALVDELFFEYHFQWNHGNFGWHSGRADGKVTFKVGEEVGEEGEHYTKDTVDDALALMSTLRKKGVATHFWI